MDDPSAAAPPAAPLAPGSAPLPTTPAARPRPVVRTALVAAVRAFALAYGIRATVALLVRLPRILGSPYGHGRRWRAESAPVLS